MPAKDFGKILLGEGFLFVDFGETTEEEMGFVRGGTFGDSQAMRNIQVDGKKGPLKGGDVLEEVAPVFNFTAVQFDKDVLTRAFYNLEAVTDGMTNITTIKRKMANPVDADYHKNVTFKGFTKAGTQVTIKLLNAIGEGPIDLAFNDREEVEIPCVFAARYATIDDTDAPFEIVIAAPAV